MTRLSLQLRLTLVFAAVMALVLVAVGAFLYVRLGDELDAQLEQRLDAGAATLQAVIRETDGEVPAGALAEQEVAQVIGADGSIIATTRAVAGELVLEPSELASARARTVLVQRAVLDDDPVLLLAEPLDAAGGGVIVVGASLESRDDAVNGLLTQLAIVIPFALLLSSLAGYALAGAALRPVEVMRERAETISAEDTSGRLPLPHAHDEIHRLGETLNAMLQRLEDGLERERRFVADASHELRTPLAALRTELDLALRRPRSSEELLQALRSASEEAERLAGLADDLLVLARSEAGQLPLARERVDATELLRTVAARSREQASAAGRSIEVVAGEPVVLMADRARLERAVANLVDNAMRHGSGAVELSARLEAGHVRLSVADRGSGFPPDFIPHAFERFSRGDDARTEPSSGLGLAIVAAIVAAHDGTVVARNAERGGAAVELALPVA